MKDRSSRLIVITLSMVLIVFLFQSCTKVPAGPPWIDSDHNLDFIWTPPANDSLVASYQIWAAFPGDTFTFNGTSIDTNYTVVLDADGFIQVKVRAIGINTLLGPFSEVSDTVWSITGVPERPGKPFWIF